MASSDMESALVHEPAWVRAVGLVVRVLNTLAGALATAGVLIALVLIGWAVFMRYALNSPPLWSDEFVGFLLVGIVMLATGESLRKGEHFGVDILTGRLTGKARTVASAWSSLAVLAAAAILVINGWQAAMFSRTLGVMSEGQLEWPIYLLLLLLPVGGVLLAINAIESLLRLTLGLPAIASGHAEKHE